MLLYCSQKFLHDITYTTVNTVIFKCAADDLQKSRKNVIFENYIKKLLFEKIEMFDVF